MAISITTIGTNNGSSGATLAVTVPAGGVSAGSIVVVVAAELTNTATPAATVADTATNSYSVKATANSASSSGFLQLFAAENVSSLSAGNTITYTKNTSGNQTSMSAVYVRNTAAAPAFDGTVTATGFGTSATPSITSGTPAVAGELLIAAAADSAVSWTQDTTHGWAAPPDPVTAGNPLIIGGSQILAGASATIWAPTPAMSVAYQMLVVGIKPPATSFLRVVPQGVVGPLSLLGFAA